LEDHIGQKQFIRDVPTLVSFIW